MCLRDYWWLRLQCPLRWQLALALRCACPARAARLPRCAALTCLHATRASITLAQTYTATSLKEAATVTKSFSSGDLVEVVTKTKEQVVDFSKRTSAQTNETTTALVDYSKRVWKISNWWRSPPQAVGRSSKPKLLIVYSDTGGGHKASATAICAAFEHLVPGQIEVKAVDVIEQYSLWPSNRTYSFFTSYPWLWSTIYKTTKQTHNLAPLLNAGVKSPANGATAADSIVVAAAAGASETQRQGDDDETGNAVMAKVHMKKKLSTQLAEAAAQYTDTPKSTMVEHLLDPAASLEPFILEGFIRCIQEERPDMIMSVHPILQVPGWIYVRGKEVWCACMPYIYVVGAGCCGVRAAFVCMPVLVSHS